MRLAVVALALLVPCAARAQLGPAPPAPTGLYERLSPLTGAPSGPLAAAPTGVLSEWLDVRTTGMTSVVAVRPAGRVVHELTYGPHGLVEKRTTVDGDAWTTSTFGYDALGRLADKTVRGPGVAGVRRYAYTLDARGRIARREGEGERIVVSYDAGGATVETVEPFPQGTTVRTRVDHWTIAGLLDTSAFGSGPAAQRLSYVRDARGVLLRVRRGGAATDVSAPRAGLTTAMIVSAQRPLTVGEADLLFGAPHLRRDEGRGAARTLLFDYADGCRLGAVSSMNEVSSFLFDAAGELRDLQASCICGFCVDARLVPDDAHADALERDAHFTRGPWVRLDGHVDVTADHRVMTPRGPVAAGALRAGDVVLDAAGAPRALRSVRRLAPGALRLGANVVTREGTFAAGGLLFESERPAACPR